MKRPPAPKGRLAPAASCMALCFALGCAGSYEGDSVSATGPTLKDFGRVAESLDYACGNLVCHGIPSRNLRLYGDQGRRLDPNDIPCGKPTTAAEIEADYRSLVGLEPELVAAVVAAHGADPESLTLVRKARGLEQHKGGSVFRDSKDLNGCVDACKSDRTCSASCYGDRCLVSWLTGAVDVPDCGNSLPVTRCNPL